ncbi:hypothetical protein [Chryseobacterium sp. WG14]|nr:hypothetical protein [Chryseobacterium sp. WG14]
MNLNFSDMSYAKSSDFASKIGNPKFGDFGEQAEIIKTAKND